MRSNARSTVLPFALMASTALMLVVLWQRTPYLFVALAGPLAAISLYQRSTHRALKAMQLALTDPLTGLGNHRHFHERLQRELDAAEETGGFLSLVLLDIDDFKRINDQHGHPSATAFSPRSRPGSGRAVRLSASVATSSRSCCPRATRRSRLAAAESILDRISAGGFGDVGPFTVSAGVACFPQHGRERDALIRLADGALYWAKEHGKNRVLARCVFSTSLRSRDAALGFVLRRDFGRTRARCTISISQSRAASRFCTCVRVLSSINSTSCPLTRLPPQHSQPRLRRFGQGRRTDIQPQFDRRRDLIDVPPGPEARTKDSDRTESGRVSVGRDDEGHGQFYRVISAFLHLNIGI